MGLEHHLVTSPHFLSWNLQRACVYFTAFRSPYHMKMTFRITSNLQSVGFSDLPYLKVSELELCDIHERPRIVPHEAGPRLENAVSLSQGQGQCVSHESSQLLQDTLVMHAPPLIAS